MSSEPVISLRNMSKTYQAYDHPIHRLISRISGGWIGRHKEFHALNNVSFDVNKGEILGIIGRNGSGKSTLLQIICGIRQPTTGIVNVKGRIAALLELGSGFQPEFTGRENIFLHGAIVGLSRREMEGRFDDIASFADIGEYIDQPVKTYSSGMFIRLAFASAIHVNPDIMVVDEALSVGDAAFQRKCYQRLESFVDSGRVLLLVSHDLEMVKRLCDLVMLLDKGVLSCYGKPSMVCDMYERTLFLSDASGKCLGVSTFTTKGNMVSGKQEYGTMEAHIMDCWIENMCGDRIIMIESGKDFTWNYLVHFENEDIVPCFAMQIKTLDGVCICGSEIDGDALSVEEFHKDNTFQVRFTLRGMLAPGTYFLNAGIRDKRTERKVFLHRRVDCGIITVIGSLNLLQAGIINLCRSVDIFKEVPVR